MRSLFLRKIANYCILVLVLAAIVSSSAVAREVKDMDGRTVSVPDVIKKVYAASPPETLLVYAVDPSLLAGLNFPFKDRGGKLGNKYIASQTLNLPVVGGYFGQGNTPNFEMLLKVNPDVVIRRKTILMNDKLESFLDKFNIPIIYIFIDELQQYPEAFEFAGKIFGKEDRGKVLADYTRKTFSQVLGKTSSIPDHKKVRVYYAEGNDGLRTENSKSFHAQVINLAGGFNVFQEGVIKRYGKEQITLERVIGYQPEVILVDQPNCYKRILSSPGWQSIPAVKNKRVYLTPKAPFNWFDRPPSFMRILGLKWTANILYPDLFNWDMKEETKEFFKVFLQKDITTEEAAVLLDTNK